MIRISLTTAAFEAIAATLPLGSVGYEPRVDTKGERLVWLDEGTVNKFGALRGPGESYSHVILHDGDLLASPRRQRRQRRALRQVEPVNLADDGAAGDAKRTCDQGGAHAACPKFFEPLDPLLGPDRFDCFEGSRHAESDSRFAPSWEAPGGFTHS